MADNLLYHYERELFFIRQMAEEFARKYPAVAGRLLLDAGRSVDPHVERLIEAFALIAGRIQNKIDDEFPELTDGLLSVLYPHALRPVPSMTVVHFALDPLQGQLPQGYEIPSGSRLRMTAEGIPEVRFRTGYPVRLWPIEVAEARGFQPPFPAGTRPPGGSRGLIRLRLQCLSGMTFSSLSLDSLRLYLDGEDYTVTLLHEFLLNHAIQVVFQPPDFGKDREKDKEELRDRHNAGFGYEERTWPLVMTPQEAIAPVGFGLDEALMPVSRRSFPGYRLLLEFFAFPAKFWFMDLSGFAEARKLGAGKELDILIYLNRSPGQLVQEIHASSFRLGCTPAVNLFEQTAEPISLTHTRYEYPIIPDVSQRDGTEIFSIDRVTAVEPETGVLRDYSPFFSVRHHENLKDQHLYWHAVRRTSHREKDHGTDMYLTLVDLQFQPQVTPDWNLVVRTTCTSRDLPRKLRQLDIKRLHVDLEAAAPVTKVHCLRPPTNPLRPPQGRGSYWRVLSHMNINIMSLTGVEDSAEALREILRLYNYATQETDAAQALVTEQIISGLTGVSHRRTVARLESTVGDVFRGVEITVELDQEKYIGVGAFLFASVLERFLGLHASINSFTQLVAVARQGKSVIKRWPPRSGDSTLF